MTLPVTTYYLEMHSPDELNAKPQCDELEIVECVPKDYRQNRDLYKLVGEKWQWTDKLDSPDNTWKKYAESDDLRTWVAYIDGAVAGYYELQKQDHGNVEIMYFGLAPAFLGQGFGGYMLTHALRSAWAWEGTKRVWVHTCTMDHDAALANYKARGMKLYKTDTE